MGRWGSLPLCVRACVCGGGWGGVSVRHPHAMRCINPWNQETMGEEVRGSGSSEPAGSCVPLLGYLLW